MKNGRLEKAFLALVLVCFFAVGFKPVNAEAATENTIEKPDFVFDANSDINPLIDITSTVQANVEGVKVDGALISETVYEVNADGDILISYAYLITLAAGDHPYEVVMSDGNNPQGKITVPDTFKVEFTVTPNTGGTVQVYDGAGGYREFGTIYYVQKNAKAVFLPQPNIDFEFNSYRLKGASSPDYEYVYSQSLILTPTEDMEIDLSFYENIYKISHDVDACDFGKVKVGYSDVPAQIVRLSNTGNATVNLLRPVMKNFDVEFHSSDAIDSSAMPGEYISPSGLDSYALSPEESVELAITPKKGLAAGQYKEEMPISTDHSTPTNVGDIRVQGNIPLSFEVYDDKPVITNNDKPNEVKPTVNKEVKPVNTKYASPKTGDVSNVTLYIVIAALAFAAVVAVIFARKNRNKQG